jgi:hypothetical protein
MTPRKGFSLFDVSKRRGRRAAGGPRSDFGQSGQIPSLKRDIGAR